MMRLSLCRLLAVGCLLVGVARADSNFDLSGPPLDIKVTRGGKTLPIGQVPNLEAGDMLWLHPDFPKQQAARYLLISAFLRGSTNPPPDDWFVRAQTWVRSVHDQGVYVTVPPDAQQALLFLAPETGGDFSTLRTNVRDRPGAFVRASQDLNQASLDRSRLDAYLSAVIRISENDPEALQDKTKLLARSLSIKLDNDCFKKPAAQQLSCLTENQNNLVLDDGHTQSMVQALTSGASADLIGQLSATSMAGAGLYSPYVGAIVDVVRIMDGFHTAQYQYIPALVESNQDGLNLKLNNPPSFSNPKSVLTVALSAVEPPQLPPLKAVDPKGVYCAETSSLVLPVDGAPLVYSTSLAHDFVLHIQQKKGAQLDLPARPDAESGGFVVDTHAIELAAMDPEATGILRGYWGFQSFDGPSFHLENAHSAHWSLLADDKSALIVGREDTVHLDADSAPCVDQVSAIDGQGKVLKASYKVVKPNELEVNVSLVNATPGPVTLEVKQTGLTKADQIPMQAYAQAAHLDSFIFHAGDHSGELEGARLDTVSKLEMDGVTFTPAGLKRNGDQDDLTLSATGDVAALTSGEKSVTRISLKDGRVLNITAIVAPPRPKVALVSKSGAMQEGSSASTVRLANQDELPQDGILTFVLQAQIPDHWVRTEKIEVGTADDSFHTTLSVEDGSLMLQDATTVLARLNPLKSFGPSAFGPLRFRAIDASGATSDWQPLGNLVRIPTLKEVQCPVDPNKQCMLTGLNLFLLDSVSASPQFTTDVAVPAGFANSELAVPRPIGTVLYIKLRDDPTAVNLAVLPVLPE